MANQEEKQHSVYAPSASERWLNCPASVNLPQEEQTDTTAADEGTLAHAIAEYKLRRESSWLDYKEELDRFRKMPLYHPEMEKYTDDYVKFILNLPHEKGIYIETKVQPYFTEPELFGTCDCFVVNENELTVIDFKYGKGRVEVKDNTQLMIYTLGVLEWLYQQKGIEPNQFTTIRNVIYQPRINNIEESFIDGQKLYKWSEQTLAPALQKLKEQPFEKHTGKWCKWCKAKTACQNERTKTADNQNSIDIGRLLDILEPLEDILKEVRILAEETIKAGGTVTGRKLVAGTPRLSWNDKKALDNIATAEALDIYKVLTPREAEKKLGKERFDELLSGLVKTIETKPLLVKEDDERESVF